MQVDLVLRGATVVTAHDSRAADVAVVGERIAAVGEHLDVRAERTVDVSGLLLLPGVVDSHVHIRDPDDDAREDFESGTAAGASGGVTTIVEMPISRPGVHDGAVLAERVRRMTGHSYADVAFYGGAGRENLDSIDELARAGVVGFKTFLHAPAPGREADFRGLWVQGPGELHDAMRRTAATGLPHAVHCEDADLSAHLLARLPAQITDGRRHAAGQPPIVEELAVATALALAADAGTHLHVVHVSSARSVAMIADAKARGQKVTAEICPNHLVLELDDLLAHGAVCKCNPPLRDPQTIAGLWAAVASGVVDVIGSDHAPFTAAEKARGADDITKAPPGIPAIELTLPVMLDAALGGRIELPRVVELLCTGPAAVFGLSAKGRVVTGADADLVLVDPTGERTIDTSVMRSKSASNLRAYHDRTLRGRVVATYLRGRPTVQDADLVGASDGRWLPGPLRR